MLPSAWVDSLFDRLSLVYGSHFLGRWSGLDLDAVKASWAKELQHFAVHPKALAYGLDHLPPDQPPTVLQFRDLCRPALRDERQPVAPALPAPKADMERVSALVAGVVRDRDAIKDPKRWAWALKAREEAERAGDDSSRRMTAYQREAWRVALQAELAAQNAEGA